MKLLLLALLALLHHLAPPVPGYCGQNAHLQCRQVGLAMSCTCVPND